MPVTTLFSATAFFPLANVADSPRYSRRQKRMNPYHGYMRGPTRHDLCILAGLYLQNEHSFVVRRCVHRFLAGEISSREAIDRIRKEPGVRDEDPDHRPDT